MLSHIVSAEEILPKKEEINHCLDQQSAAENESLVRKYPADTTLVRLAAIRIGLCDFVDKGIITVRKATEIFELEKVKGITKKWKDEIKFKNEHKI